MLSSVLTAPLRGVASWLFPPLCLGCRAYLDDPSPWCPPCEATFRPIGADACRLCGVPKDAYMFTPRHKTYRMCSACQDVVPVYDAAHAAWRYEGALRDALPRAKYAGDLGTLSELARWWTPWLQRQLDRLPQPPHAITCPPAHPKSLGRRGFDPAHTILRAARQALGTTHAWRPDLLTKTRPTPRQAGLSEEARARNMHDAFEAREGPETVIILDDVMTTGATADAMARALKTRGTRWVEVWTMARASNV